MQTDRSAFLALSELARRYRAPRRENERGPLTEYELCCFSQHGEDGVIAEILRRLDIQDGFFVEFGIESGREGNCVALADVRSWHGLFIEADTSGYAALERKYAANPRVRTLQSLVTPDNIQSLLARAEVPLEPDVLSIDVDGADYWIWSELGDYRPAVVVIEYNSSLPPGRLLVQPRTLAGGWQGTDFFGASLDALAQLGTRLGYRLVHTDLAGANAFFVRADLAGARFADDGLVARWHEPNYFVQGYHHPPDETDRRYEDLGSRPPGSLSETS